MYFWIRAWNKESFLAERSGKIIFIEVLNVVSQQCSKIGLKLAVLVHLDTQSSFQAQQYRGSIELGGTGDFFAKVIAATIW